MNITVFKRITIGEFTTYLDMLTDSLPTHFAEEKRLLKRACEEMEFRLNADRRNHTLKILKEEDMPRLRFLVSTLGEELRLCRTKNENEEDIQKYIQTKFKKRKDIERMVNEAKVLCEYGTPKDEYCRTLFERIKNLTTEMDERVMAMGAESARICGIGSCKPVRNEAVRLLHRIKERAVGLSYEAETRVMAMDVMNTLETLISMGERGSTPTNTKTPRKRTSRRRKAYTEYWSSEEADRTETQPRVDLRKSVTAQTETESIKAEQVEMASNEMTTARFAQVGRLSVGIEETKAETVKVETTETTQTGTMIKDITQEMEGMTIMKTAKGAIAAEEKERLNNEAIENNEKEVEKMTAQVKIEVEDNILEMSEERLKKTRKEVTDMRKKVAELEYGVERGRFDEETAEFAREKAKEVYAKVRQSIEGKRIRTESRTIKGDTLIEEMGISEKALAAAEARRRMGKKKRKR